MDRQKINDAIDAAEKAIPANLFVNLSPYPAFMGVSELEREARRDLAEKMAHAIFDVIGVDHE